LDGQQILQEGIEDKKQWEERLYPIGSVICWDRGGGNHELQRILGRTRDGRTEFTSQCRETIKNQILQILSQPQYAQQKAAWDRLQANPQLYQAFMSDVATESGGTTTCRPLNTYS
jgi:hypothetical protein